MLLSELAAAVPGSRLAGDALVEALVDDSRLVGHGALFLAMPGSRTDGHLHASAAVAGGAVAVVAERPVDAAVATLLVPSVRAAAGPLSAAFHGHPSRRMAVVGVTGTNGKTTTTTLLRMCLEAADVPAGQIGTVGTRFADRSLPASLTTPQAPELQGTLAAMAGAGVEAVAMEVSSHALDQRRVDGISFALGVFTNLSSEHLDYHGTVEQYWASKAMLFEPGRCASALVDVDDEWGRRLAHQVRIPVATFGTSPEADVRYVVVEHGLRGIAVDLPGVDGTTVLRSPLVGRANAGNVVAAYLAARHLGVTPARAAAGIASSTAPPGRFELVEAGQPFLVVVDYAHTPDALAALIATARGLTGPGGRVAVVVGARGGRDRFKRPVLGRTAAAADRVFLTTDSPGEEPVPAIIDQLRLGALEAGGRAEIRVEPDRRLAIADAVQQAAPGDVVLIVGRGHEVVQHVDGHAVPLDDRVVARQALEAAGAGHGAPMTGRCA